MANIQITQLPAAGAITGTEAVPIVQNGVTVQTTTGAIAASPAQTQTFLTVNQEPTLANSRYVGVGSGLTISDGGAQGLFQIGTTGALSSLISAGNGIMAKTGSTTLTPRTLQTSGQGITITNGDGVSGDPTIALDGLSATIAGLSGYGQLTLLGTGATIRQLVGTADQITVTDGSGTTGNPTFAIANNPILPGTESTTLTSGPTSSRPLLPTLGMIRFNTDLGAYEGYVTSGWQTFSTAGGVASFSGGTTGLLPSVPTSGAVTLSGTLGVPNGGTGAVSLTGYVKGNGTSAMTASATVPTTDLSGTVSNSQLANSAITINGNSVSLGGSTTVTASTTSTLTIGTGLSGTSFNGSSPVTIAIDSTVATLTGTQTLTNKSISGATNTLTAIPNSALSNSTISGISLGSNLNALTIGTGLSGTSYNGSSSVTIAIDSTVATLTGTQTFTNKSISGATNTLTAIPNSALDNSSITIGSTAISLGGTSTTLAGLTSVTLTQDPSADLQAATKQYVDAKTSTGLTYHAPVQAATTQSLAAQTGGTVTYNNGVAGVGATITLSVALNTLDGYSLLNTDRILVKDEINQAYNGVYTWATGGLVLTRATDADTYGPNVGQLSQNDYFFVQNGTVNKGSSYVVTTVGAITFGTTAITFAEFSNSQVYSAGTGLTLTGTTFSITNTGVTNGSYGVAASVPTIAINAQGQITSASNTAIAINGNQITSGTVGSSYISGSYTGITGVGTLTAGTWNADTIAVGYGGTGFASYAIGDILYASGTGTLSKLTIGANGYVLTSTGSAPQYVAQSTLSVGSATNATNTTNVEITADSTNATRYLTFVSATTGNLPELVNSSITCNPSTGNITAGIAGGTF